MRIKSVRYLGQGDTRADEYMYNGGKNDRSNWCSNGSQSPQIKILRASQRWNVIRKDKEGVEDYTQISNVVSIRARNRTWRNWNKFEQERDVFNVTEYLYSTLSDIYSEALCFGLPRIWAVKIGWKCPRTYLEINIEELGPNGILWTQEPRSTVWKGSYSNVYSYQPIDRL